MIVFDLRCDSGHVFEAWFASGSAYDDQAAAGQVACPLCGVTKVAKAVMAPSIAAKSNRSGNGPAPAAVKAMLRQMAEHQATALRDSEWVGSAFADRARSMHEGVEAVRPIHGQASLAEAKALVEEGVPVAPLPFPVVPPEKAN